MSRTKLVLLWLMAVVYAFAGFNHLLNPDFYVLIMPPGLPNPEWLNVLSGLAEIVLGVFILEPRVRVYAAWGIIAASDRGLSRQCLMSRWRTLGPGVPGRGT